MFKDLLKQEPFKTAFSNIHANDAKTFYDMVRCGLLHEARTCGHWVIRTRGPKGILVEKKGGEIRLYRNQLIPLLNLHLKGYRAALSCKPDLQENFKTKFDHLCTG